LKKGTPIGITGTPGTGKKTVGKIVAKELGFEFLNLNWLALRVGAVIGRDKFGFIVDARKLRRAVLEKVREKNVLLVGHLLPQVLKDDEVDFVVILRCSPYVLEKRLEKRGYVREKILENVGAEILDVCLLETLERFSKEKILEVDTSGRRKDDVAKEIVERFRAGRGNGVFGTVDWLELVSKNGDLPYFFPSPA